MITLNQIHRIKLYFYLKKNEIYLSVYTHLFNTIKKRMQKLVIYNAVDSINKSVFIELSKTNLVYVNNISLNNSLIEYNNHIFNVIHKDILPNQNIFMNQYIRSKLLLEIGQTIDVKKYNGINQNVKNITCIFEKSSKKIINIHEDYIKFLIINQLKNNYIKGIHYFNIKLDDQLCKTIIQSSSPIFSTDEGYLNDTTKIEIISNDLNIRIIKPNLMNINFFNKSFNFSSFGIGGLDSKLSNIFIETLSTRAINPTIIKKMKLKHKKGILLYGPPGTGKTLIARNISKQLSNIEPKVVNGPEVISSYIGKSEENIRSLFMDAINDYQANKDNSSLHIIIFDEIDAICRKRSGSNSVSSNVNDSMVNQLLSIIDGVDSPQNIFIIAMTNRIDLIDPALLRAGRIETHVFIDLPDINARKEIFKIHMLGLSSNQMLDENLNINKFAELTENFSGAEIESVVKNASSYAIGELLQSGKSDGNIIVTDNHFINAINKINPMFGSNIGKYSKKDTILLSDDYKNNYNKLKNMLIKDNQNNLSILLYGQKGIGKTVFVEKLSKDVNIPYIKIIRAIDLINMNELEKINYITEIYKNSQFSTNSLIIIDDIEIILECVEIDYRCIFSHKIYHSILTILRSKISDNKINIIVNCGNLELYNILKGHFDYHILHKPLSVQEAMKICELYKIKTFLHKDEYTIDSLLKLQFVND